MSKSAGRMIPACKPTYPKNPKSSPQYFAGRTRRPIRTLSPISVTTLTSPPQKQPSRHSCSRLPRTRPHNTTLAALPQPKTHWRQAVECFAQARNAAGSPVVDEAQHQLRLVGGWVNEAASRRKDVSAMFTLATMYDKSVGTSHEIFGSQSLLLPQCRQRRRCPSHDAPWRLIRRRLLPASTPIRKTRKSSTGIKCFQCTEMPHNLIDPEAKTWIAQHDAH